MREIERKLWKTEENANLIDLVKNLKKNEKYLLKSKNKVEYDLLEKYIFDIVSYELDDEQFIEKENYIEFFILNETKLHSEYNNKLKTGPTLSFLSFFNKSNSIIFTDIDNESYKFKEFHYKEDIQFLRPDKFQYIVFNGNHYHGFPKLNNENNLIEPIYLKINLWNIKPELSKDYISEENSFEFFKFVPMQINNSLHKKIYDGESTINAILYNDEKNKEKYEKILLENIEENNILITIIKIRNTDVSYLRNRYGKIADTIIPFMIKDIEIAENNPLNKNKLIHTVIAKEVCYWIINECEQKNKWEECVYPMYDLYINVEKLPGVLNYILFMFRHWLFNIRTLYGIEETVDIVIDDIFISKCSSCSKIKKEIIDNIDNFLTVEILLNDKTDFKGGEITIDGDKIIMNQCDMLVYNGRKNTAYEIISQGDKYILVIKINIVD